MSAPAGFGPATDEMLAVVDRVIRQYGANDLAAVVDARIVVLSRDKAEAIEREVQSIAAVGAATDEDELAQFDFILWLAQDVWQTLSETEREALVFHELMHCDRDEAGRPALRTHDAAVFNREVELYGLWWVAPQRVFDENN